MQLQDLLSVAARHVSREPQCQGKLAEATYGEDLFSPLTSSSLSLLVVLCLCLLKLPFRGPNSREATLACPKYLAYVDCSAETPGIPSIECGRRLGLRVLQ